MVLLGTRGWDRKAWKYRLATLLDKLPGTCWTALVCWVEYGQETLPETLERGNATCQRSAEEDGRCYCGKVRRA